MRGRGILRSSHSLGPTPMSVPPSDRGYAGSWPRCVGAEGTLRVPLEWSDGAGTGLVLLKYYEQEQGEHHDARDGVHDDPDQGAAVTPRWVGLCQGVDEQGLRNHPRHVQVVEREQQAVGSPVPAAKCALHPRQKQAAEQKLLSEDGVEHHQDDLDSVEDPVAGEELPTRSGLEEDGEVVAGYRWERGEETLRAEEQRGRNDDEPERAADASGCRAARCLKPQGVLKDRPAQRTPLSVNQDQHQHELPDQADRQQAEKGARQGYGPVEPACDQRSHDPGKGCHRQRRSCPDAQDLCQRVLLHLTLARRPFYRGFSFDTAASSLPFRTHLHLSSFRNLACAKVRLSVLRVPVMTHIEHTTGQL